MCGNGQNSSTKKCCKCKKACPEKKPSTMNQPAPSFHVCMILSCNKSCKSKCRTSSYQPSSCKASPSKPASYNPAPEKGSKQNISNSPAPKVSSCKPSCCKPTCCRPTCCKQKYCKRSCKPPCCKRSSCKKSSCERSICKLPESTMSSGTLFSSTPSSCKSAKRKQATQGQSQKQTQPSGIPSKGTPSSCQSAQRKQTTQRQPQKQTSSSGTPSSCTPSGGTPSSCKPSNSKPSKRIQTKQRQSQSKTTSSNRASPSKSKVPSTWFESPQQESLRQAFLKGINDERRALGLPTLTLDPLLNECAAKHNYDQAFIMDGIYHTGSDGSRLSERLKRVGYTCSWAGENVAHRQKTPEWAVASLMKSPGHRKNIVNVKARKMGIHGGIGKDGYWYWTQLLAAPKREA